MTEWTIQLEPEPSPEIREQILAPLVRHNDAQAGPGQWRQCVITVRDENDAIVGGLQGRIGYGFMYVELLAMGPAQGNGVGRRVMALAEVEARTAGLDGIWLNTWTFQAPGFYEKLGFVEFGRIEDYPPGHSRIFYVKRFAGPDSPSS